jgi:CubicO group peptidase (beta-lactamase class C family)
MVPGADNAIAGMIGRYVTADYLAITPKSKPESLNRYLPKSAGYNLVIIAVGENDSNRPSNEGKINQAGDVTSGSQDQSMTEAETRLLSEFPEGTKTIWLLYGSQRFLDQWSVTESSSAVVVTGKADFDRMDLSAQLIFGAVGTSGRLPFDLNKYRKGSGVTLNATGRLSYVLPEELGIDSARLAKKMDSIVGIGLKAKAFPGCQLLLAKNGKVFYQRAYGFQTYDRTLAVQNGDLYDLASVTKILAPVPALMFLADQKKFLVTKKMSEYWPDWKGTNKEGIVVSDLLTHQARLRAGVILWPGTLDGQKKYKPEYYSSQSRQGYNLSVSNGLWLINSYPDSVYKEIRDSPLLKTKKYAYSDLGFVILPKVIENLSGEPYEKFLNNRLYAKLGATSLMYHPIGKVPREKIVPTENDCTFRHELLQGYVHDETAALMGGVSGNAGLFGNAGDVAKVMQLYLQDGTYGGERFISEETVQDWTSSHFKKTNNRRGYGFDKPGIQVNRNTGKERYPSSVVSDGSFGHSGYTGTFVWADPSGQLLFVFLSNRVCPDRDNHKINKLRLRPLLLESFFKLAR